MTDQKKTPEELQKEADGLLAEIQTANQRFLETTGVLVDDLNKDLDALEKGLDSFEADMEAFGADVSREISAEAFAMERALGTLDANPI